MSTPAALQSLPEAPLIAGDAPEGGRAFWAQADDGARLRIGYWPGPRLLLLLPGRTEYIEKYGLVLGDLARAGWGALVIDWRGQGLSSRLAPDAALGHVGAFADYQRDLAVLLSLARGLSERPLPILAHSMGGCITFRALVRGLRPPAVALSAPMLGLAQPAHTRWMIRALAGTARLMRRDGGYVPSTGPEFGLPTMPYAANPLTGDRAQFNRMQAQIREHAALALGGPSLRWAGLALAETADIVIENFRPGTMERLGLSKDELTEILQRYRQSLNLGVEDLARLIGAAELQAAAHRTGPLTAADVMSRDLVTVAPHTRLVRVADIFRKHGFTSLPVVEAGDQFRGVIFQLHLIRRAREDAFRHNRRFLAALSDLMNPRRGTPPRAREIMQTDPPHVAPDAPIGTLLPMLASGECEAVPVLDGSRIVGIVTRTDLISALARQSLRQQPPTP